MFTKIVSIIIFFTFSSMQVFGQSCFDDYCCCDKDSSELANQNEVAGEQKEGISGEEGDSAKEMHCHHHKTEPTVKKDNENSSQSAQVKKEVKKESKKRHCCKGDGPGLYGCTCKKTASYISSPILFPKSLELEWQIKVGKVTYYLKSDKPSSLNYPPDVPPPKVRWMNEFA